jgi:hypothetical protein
MGRGVSALGAGALGMVGERGSGVCLPYKNRFLRPMPCLAGVAASLLSIVSHVAGVTAWRAWIKTNSRANI